MTSRWDFSKLRLGLNPLHHQYAHFHGTDDGAIKYDGQNPGPAFLKNAEVIAAQL